MLQILRLTGSLSAITGILICALSGLSRVLGLYYVAGYQTTTIFTVGTGLMVFACLIKLETMSIQLSE